MSDDVLDLLDSIDHDTKAKPKRTRKPKGKRHNDEIMDFLDELASEGTPSSTPAPEAAEAHQPANSSATAAETRSSTEAPSSADDLVPEDPIAPRENLPDPLSSLTSWWNRARPGLVEAAQTAANRASEAVKHRDQINLGNLQKGITSLMSQIVPPISKHEQLTVHIFHDLAGYGQVDEIVRDVFERVMDQVEGGGALNMVAQKGAARSASASAKKNLNLFYGTEENAVKLAVASIEDFRRDHAAPQPPAGEVSISEIFISVGAAVFDEAPPSQAFAFVCCLSDVANNVSLHTCSQRMPREWAEWLDDSKDFDAADPRPWILEWVDESLGLAIGTLAQQYVLLRMGISKPEASQPEASK